MKPRVLLVGINAKFIHTNLAIRMLKANAGEYEPLVEICEYTINHRREEILAHLYEKKPEVVGFSCYLWNIEYVLAVAEDLKKILPDLRIIVGGPEVSYHPAEVLEQYPFIDLIMIGEGERTFREYLAWSAAEYTGDEAELELHKIDGLAYRKPNINRGKKRGDDCENGGESASGIVVTRPRQGMPMDELVFPYRDLAGLENRILYYESIRGCPFACSYCLSSIEKTVRIKSPEKTKRELDFFLEHKVPQVKFVDRTFNCNHNYAYEIWRYIGEHDNGITNFHFEIGGDLLREEDFELFKGFRPGLVQFEIGVQSTNEKTIKAIRRTMDLEKLRYNIARVHSGRNIHQHLDLIAGLPFEDYESFRKSFHDVYAMKPDQLQLGFLKVLTGSYMNEVKEEYEVRFSSYPPYEVFFTKWLSFEDVLKLKQVEEMVEVYYNSFQFQASMAYLVPFFNTPFDMYEALGQYYQKNQLFDVKHSRIRRYEILYDFCKERLGHNGCMDEIREVLTYDLYSRDYVKNPPAFVLPRSETLKKRIRCFLEAEAESPEEIQGYEGMAAKQLFNLLYMDSFVLDMEILMETGEKRRGKEQYLMFDYRRRNPLNHSAGVTRISLPELPG